MDSPVCAPSKPWLRTLGLHTDPPAGCWWTLDTDDAAVGIVHSAWPATIDEDVAVETALRHVQVVVGALDTDVVGVCGGEIDDARWGDHPTDITPRVESVAGAC